MPWSASEQVARIAPGQCPPELGQRITLDPSHPLGRQVEELAHFALGPRLAPVQAVAQRKDPSLVFRQASEELVDLPRQQGLRHRLERGLRRMVDHKVAQARVAVFADSGVKAHRVAVVMQQLSQHCLFYLEGLCQLGQRRWTAVLGLQLSLHPAGTTDTHRRRAPGCERCGPCSRWPARSTDGSTT